MAHHDGPDDERWNGMNSAKKPYPYGTTYILIPTTLYMWVKSRNIICRLLIISLTLIPIIQE